MSRNTSAQCFVQLIFWAGDVLCTAFFTPYRSPLILRHSA
jgi:hypothetical protein